MAYTPYYGDGGYGGYGGYGYDGYGYGGGYRYYGSGYYGGAYPCGYRHRHRSRLGLGLAVAGAGVTIVPGAGATRRLRGATTGGYYGWLSRLWLPRGYYGGTGATAAGYRGGYYGGYRGGLCAATVEATRRLRMEAERARLARERPRRGGGGTTAAVDSRLARLATTASLLLLDK